MGGKTTYLSDTLGLNEGNTTIFKQMCCLFSQMGQQNSWRQTKRTVLRDFPHESRELITTFPFLFLDPYIPFCHMGEEKMYQMSCQLIAGSYVSSWRFSFLLKDTSVVLWHLPPPTDLQFFVCTGARLSKLGLEQRTHCFCAQSILEWATTYITTSPHLCLYSYEWSVIWMLMTCCNWSRQWITVCMPDNREGGKWTLSEVLADLLLRWGFKHACMPFHVCTYIPSNDSENNGCVSAWVGTCWRR